MKLFDKLHETASLWPVTTTYIFAVGGLVTVAQGWVGVTLAIALLGLMTVAVILVSMRREISTVHILINSQRDELVDRIVELTETLKVANVHVPDSTTDVDASVVAATQRRKGEEEE